MMNKVEINVLKRIFFMNLNIFADNKIIPTSIETQINKNEEIKKNSLWE